MRADACFRMDAGAKRLRCSGECATLSQAIDALSSVSLERIPQMVPFTKSNLLGHGIERVSWLIEQRTGDEQSTPGKKRASGRKSARAETRLHRSTGDAKDGGEGFAIQKVAGVFERVLKQRAHSARHDIGQLPGDLRANGPLGRRRHDDREGVAQLVKPIADDLLDARACDLKKLMGAHRPQITPRDERVLRERLMDSAQRSNGELMRRSTSLDNGDGDFPPADRDHNVELVIELEDMRPRGHQSTQTFDGSRGGGHPRDAELSRQKSLEKGIFQKSFLTLWGDFPR